MSSFEKLRAVFDVNWTTILVGWKGLGALSPWPNRWTEFPPLISAEEIVAYADEQLSLCSDSVRQDLIVAFAVSDLQCKTREEIRGLLEPLSNLDEGDLSTELRKWRLILLEDLLAHMPKGAIDGLMALTEFWQDFGFPSDSPHEVQGRGNTITPYEYYREENLQRLIDRHHAWIAEERALLQGKNGVGS